MSTPSASLSHACPEATRANANRRRLGSRLAAASLQRRGARPPTRRPSRCSPLPRALGGATLALLRRRRALLLEQRWQKLLGADPRRRKIVRLRALARRQRVYLGPMRAFTPVRRRPAWASRSVCQRQPAQLPRLRQRRALRRILGSDLHGLGPDRLHGAGRREWWSVGVRWRRSRRWWCYE